MAWRNHPVGDYESVVDDGTQFIDVRQPEEHYADGVLPGAVNIPLPALPSRMSELDPHRRVVLLCRSGNRSGQAAEFLSSAGFDDVINLDGGMVAWSAAVS